MKIDFFNQDQSRQGLIFRGKGQSLIEVLAALAVLMLVILSLVWITTVSIRNADFSKKQAQATSYVKEAMEKIRAYRDRNSWDVFKNNCGNASVMGISSPVPFSLTISCITIGGDDNKREITVTVSWSDSKGTHQSKSTSYFTKWR